MPIPAPADPASAGPVFAGPVFAGPVFALAPGVHGAAVDADLVFLDLAAGAYTCLADGARDVRRAPDGTVTIADAALAADLRAAGLIVPRAAATAQAAGPPPRTAAAPAASALRWAYPPPRPADLAPLAQAVGDVLAGYRGRALAAILAAAPRPAGAAAADPETLQAAVDRFHAWIPFAPLSGKCLLRSFVLRRYLARRGLAADWVFGVATWPFRAHCWLQAGGLVLDDTVERVARYAPILVA